MLLMLLLILFIIFRIFKVVPNTTQPIRLFRGAFVTAGFKPVLKYNNRKAD